MAEACYTPLYLPASFKGVSFVAEESTSEHGRRGAEGEFPFGESTAYADLGRKIRRYTIKGRFQNNAHIASSSLLIAACESPGPGLLIHPTRGAVLVACTKLSVSDDPLNEQGISHLDLEFVEANEVATGLSVGLSIFGLAVNVLYGVLGDSFEVNYVIDDVPYWRVPSVLDASSDAMQAISLEFGKAITGTDDNGKWSALATMRTYVHDSAKLADSKQAFKAFRQSIITLANTAKGQAKYDSFKTIANKVALVSRLPEEAGDAENAMFGMVRILAVTQMVKAALEVPTTTIDAALNQYDEIVTIMDQELAASRSTCEDDVYIQLRKFETEAKVRLLQRAYGLPALIEYDFHGGVNSLMAAYDIFNDAKRFKEIEDRNPGHFPWSIASPIIAARV